MRVRLGKVPKDLLEKIVFKSLGKASRDVLVGPAFGEDSAVVRVRQDKVVVAMDPITGASSIAGWLAVHVNANDVAVAGAKPRWFSSCVLLPPNSKVDDLKNICNQMDKASKLTGVCIVTGHTEFTDCVTKPLIIGCMAGTLVSRSYFRSSGARAGDYVIMTKTAGIEGTAILCTDLRDRLKKSLGSEVVKRGSSYYNMISVVKEALILARSSLVTSMHDPTEGGVLGGLYEVAEASGCSFLVEEERIPVSSETKKVCSELGADPLKLISSGVLLATARKPYGLIRRLSNSGIRARVIGRMVRRRLGSKIIRSDGSEERIDRPVEDELWNIVSYGS